MEKEQKRVTSTQRVNGMVMITYSIITFILLVAYALEFF
jgi:hypothetical protein